jgi:hypothetical protein
MRYRLLGAILGLFVMTTAATAQVGVFVGPNGGVAVTVAPGWRGDYYDGMPGWRGTSPPFFYGGPVWGGYRGFHHRGFRGRRWHHRHGWRRHH